MAKRGRKKRTKPEAEKSSSGPGRPEADDSEPPEWHLSGNKRQRLGIENGSEGISDDDTTSSNVKVEEGEPPGQPAMTTSLTQQASMTPGGQKTQAACPLGTGGGPMEDAHGGLVIKSEPFDTGSYEMSDLLLNGSVDSIMDMPLFHEVDSLMNIKHEDHLNDTVFYLPMSYPLDTGVKVEVDRHQVAEATRTLASELAAPNELVYVTPDIPGSCGGGGGGAGAGGHGSKATAAAVLSPPLSTSMPASSEAATAPSRFSDTSSTELRAQLKLATPGGDLENGAPERLTNGHHAGAARRGQGRHGQLNGYTSLQRVSVGKGSKRCCKKTDSGAAISDPVRKSKKALSNGGSSSKDCGSRQSSIRSGSSSSSSGGGGAAGGGAGTSSPSISESGEEDVEEDENSAASSSSSSSSPHASAPATAPSHDTPPTIAQSPITPAPPQPTSGAVVDDPPEIDRFVICSDHTMECVLCAFTTDSYSAFKSHIICSHPCWRITKKLSKNRLLVERSVRAAAAAAASVNSAGGGGGGMTFSSSSTSSSDLAALRTTKGGGSGGARAALHAKNEQELQKVLRKYEKNPRKRQLFERNKRLFKCTICLRLFVFEGSVVNHVTDQHGLSRPYDHIHISNDHGQRFGPIYRCGQKNCYFSCESEHELERHGLERHTHVMYRCQLCGYTADSAEAVRSHGLCMHQQQLTCFDSTV